MNTAVSVLLLRYDVMFAPRAYASLFCLFFVYFCEAEGVQLVRSPTSHVLQNVNKVSLLTAILARPSGARPDCLLIPAVHEFVYKTNLIN